MAGADEWADAFVVDLDDGGLDYTDYHCPNSR